MSERRTHDLDPATLRWVADELEHDLERINGMVADRDQELLDAKLSGHARRLRNRATRIERKRGTP